jgi:HD-like signal output (HDOD) protein
MFFSSPSTFKLTFKLSPVRSLERPLDALQNAMLTRAFSDLTAWTRHLRGAAIPVLAGTAEQLALLREAEERTGNVDAHMLAEAIEGDPLMTLKVISYMATHRPAALLTDAETVTAAIVHMGIGPFFRAFGDVATIDSHLEGQPEALAGLNAVLQRAHRASRFALAFAVHRMDGDAEVIREATLLHDFAEMLLWCHAPALALEITRRQAVDPQLRSAEAQLAVLNVTLPELEQSLMRAWRLPELLIRITNDDIKGRLAAHPQAATVRLAVQLARHTRYGWDNPALPDDIQEIAELLNLSTESTLRKLQEIDRDGD